MEDEDMQNPRLLYDRECNGCDHNSTCEWIDTPQCCRRITNKLRDELGKRKKQRSIISKISISTEYSYVHHKTIKTVAEKGTFVLQEAYVFGERFLRAGITGEGNGGTFETKNYGWNKS